MWIVRELARLATRIALAALIAVVVAEAWAIASGNDPLWAFQITCYLLGALLLMLDAGGGGANERRIQAGRRYRGGTVGLPGFGARPGDPTLSPGAVFFGAALALFVIGYLA